MKALNISFSIFAILLYGTLTFAQNSLSSAEISLDEVSKTIKAQNFSVLQNATRLYQAKESINVARGNLLPKLNIWKIVTAVADPVSLYGLIQDIAPFLVPANWFRLEQSKILYRAEVEGYQALWGNELLTAKSLYLQVLLDQALLEALRFAVDRHTDIEETLKIREMMGSVPAGSTRFVQIKKLALESDCAEMQVLIRKELNELGFALGMTEGAQPILKAVALPTLNLEKPLDAKALDAGVKKASPELRQFSYLLQVLPSIKKEVYFSFLGASSVSRGVAGGVFDKLPIQDGLGFGTGASLRIIRSEEAILKIQIQGLNETLSRQLALVVDRHNFDLMQSINLLERKKLSEEQWNLFKSQILLGEDVDFASLIQTTEAAIGIDMLIHQLNYRFLINQQKLDRLLFAKDYIPPSISNQIISEKRTR